MNKLFELAARISSAWSLAAFAIVALVLLAVKLKGRKVTPVGWAATVAIVVVTLAPMIAPLYLDTYGIYRVRIIVLDENHQPADLAEVKCSAPGELTQAHKSWECDIPAKSRPNGKVQIYAAVPDAFLTGQAELELRDDYHPVITISLSHDRSAKIMGIVLENSGHDEPLEGVLVNVVGYESEAQLTHKGGNFSLPAHGANGEPIRLAASKTTYDTVVEWHQAGNFPVTIRLNHQGVFRNRL